MKVKIEKLDHFGQGITKVNDKICFVKKALPEEIIDLEITKETKKFQEGKITKIYKESQNRCTSICPYYNECGGCNFLHLSFDEENKYKKQKVKELLEKYAGIKENVITDISSTEEYNYRNKIVLHGKDKKVGLYKEKSNDIVEINNCKLVSQKINNLLKTLNGISSQSNIEKITIRTSNDENKIILKLEGEVSDINTLKENTDVLIVNDTLFSKADKIISHIGNKKYYVSIDSFFQVNKTLTQKLYDEVLNYVEEIRPNKVLDLYCGTGTIGIYISDYAKEIIGIDYSKSGIKDANENKLLNNINNIDFICDKVENVIDTFKNDIDLVIVDPPRAGLDTKTISNIKRINAKNVIYISCDPVTLSRDINSLKDMYEVTIVKPFNMFPKTYHVECFSILKQKQ